MTMQMMAEFVFKAMALGLALALAGIFVFMAGFGEQFAARDPERHNIATAWLIIWITATVIGALLILLLRRMSK